MVMEFCRRTQNINSSAFCTDEKNQTNKTIPWHCQIWRCNWKEKHIMLIILKEISFVHFISCSIPILKSLYIIQSIRANSAKISPYTLLTFKTGFSTQGKTTAGHRSHLVSPLIKGSLEVSHCFKRQFFETPFCRDSWGVLCHILHYPFKK